MSLPPDNAIILVDDHTPTQLVAPFLDDVVPSPGPTPLSDPGSFYDDPYGMLAPGVVTNNPHVLVARDPVRAPSPVDHRDHIYWQGYFGRSPSRPGTGYGGTPAEMGPPRRVNSRFARAAQRALEMAVLLRPNEFDVVPPPPPPPRPRFRPWYNRDIYAGLYYDHRQPFIPPTQRGLRGLRRWYSRDEDFEAAEARAGLPRDQEEADLLAVDPAYHRRRLRYVTRRNPY